jgi:hypothetical protein
MARLYAKTVDEGSGRKCSCYPGVSRKGRHPIRTVGFVLREVPAAKVVGTFCLHLQRSGRSSGPHGVRFRKAVVSLLTCVQFRQNVVH